MPSLVGSEMCIRDRGTAKARIYHHLWCKKKKGKIVSVGPFLTRINRTQKFYPTWCGSVFVSLSHTAVFNNCIPRKSGCSSQGVNECGVFSFGRAPSRRRTDLIIWIPTCREGICIEHRFNPGVSLHHADRAIRLPHGKETSYAWIRNLSALKKVRRKLQRGDRSSSLFFFSFFFFQSSGGWVKNKAQAPTLPRVIRHMSCFD